MTAPDPDDAPSEPGLLKIGDFARAAATNLRTLRYYEELGLLHPTKRSKGGFRYYRASDIHRLNMIRDLQELGLPLERIRELMATREAADERDLFLRRVREALSEQDRLLVERMRLLEEQRQRIAVAVRKLTECECCKIMPSHSNNFCEPCCVTGQALPPKVSALF